jgi:putative nucleotidyltransferase with HDIG domain
MRRNTQSYVAAVFATALVGGWLLYRASIPISAAVLTDVAVLSALGITAELLAILLPRSAIGTFSFIPYFTAAIIVPSWPTVAAVAIVKAAAEIWSRRPALKAVLNISAHTIGVLGVIVIYRTLGGVALRNVPNVGHLADATRAAAVPALLAFVIASTINNLIVTAAIAISSGRTLSEVLRSNHNRANFGLEIVAWPLVFVFAWVYAVYGVMAAAALWVPILGLRQLYTTNIELEQTNEELLELMVKSIEARDPYTSGHSRRVHQFSTVIARAIGLGANDVEHVGRAALLHDVGKIYEKYAGVLSKQDKLTPEEWAIIQEHPADGANLVATMTRLRDLVPAIRHHHENWDGTGYPDRIAGSTIPLAARIIRFADTIDAMTTERPYRRPLTEAQVRAEVIRCRGTQFDPEIADKLLSSPLWMTLFAPSSNDPRITPLAVVGRAPSKLPFSVPTKASRRA